MVFLDFPSEERLERRLKRDTTERGFPKEQVEKEFRESAEKIHNDLILPSKSFATHVVSDEDSFSKLVQELGEKFKDIINS